LWIKTDTGAFNPNNFAAALILPIAIVATAAIKTRRVLAKLACLAGLGVLLSAVYASGSRGALIAIVVLFAYLLWKSRRRVQIALLIAGAAIASTPFVGQLSTRLSTMVPTGGAGRVSIWNVGLEAFKHHWLLGVGVGNFPLAYNEAFIRVYQAVSAGWNRGSHNVIEEAGVELGIFGLILILGVWLVQFRQLQHIGKSHPMYHLRVGSEATMLALFVASMFADNMYSKYTWLAFATVMLVRSLSKSRMAPDRLRGRTASDVHRETQPVEQTRRAARPQEVVV
jgi:O-antigen ligase